MTLDARILPARAVKSQMRALVRSRIGALPAVVRASADEAICRHLCDLVEASGVKVVLGYLGLPDEVRVDRVLCAMVEGGRTVLIPRSGNGQLLFGAWRPGTALSRDEEGALAPAIARENTLGAGPGLIVVPGRAFDAEGGRLGRGGGYYDRLLAAVARGWLVAGAAYECQVVAEVPREDHDRNVEVLVTESECRRVG